MTKLLPNAVEAIKEASKFARLGIVTTKTAEYSKILLEHMEIMDYFEVLIGREDVQNPKPHPEPILKAMELMSVTKSNNVWMIGDTCLDLLSAKAAGIRSVGVLSGYGTREELEHCSSEALQNETLLAIKHIINSNKADIK
jgi:phosphoglycolate phosphatase